MKLDEYNEKIIDFLKKEFKNISNDEFNEKLEMLKSNSNGIIQNIDKYKKFLIFGDIQSGKTINLIFLVSQIINKGFNTIIYLTGTKNNLLLQNQSRFFDSFEKIDPNLFYVMNSRNKENLKKIIDIKIMNKKIVIINSLKNPFKLRDILDSLSESEYAKTLIIDDEGDESSFGDKTFLFLNKIIELNNNKYISITASPYKNLTLDFFDYYHILKHDNNYCGFNEFWDNYVIFKDKLNNTDVFCLPLIKWSILILKNKYNKSQILFNISNKKIDHDNIYEELCRIIDLLRSKKQIKYLLEFFNLDTNLCNEIFEFFQKISKEKNIIIDNSNHNNDKKNTNQEDLQIIIGGMNLSRGITYNNLLIEVMINIGKTISANTLIQRMRWFGYRNNTIKNMIIYTNQTAYNGIKELDKLNDVVKKYNITRRNFKKIFDAFRFEVIEL